MATPFSDLQEIAPSAIIELFQLELNLDQHGVSEIYYFHAGTSLNANGNIVWDSQEYLRYPVEATDFEYSGSGQLPRPKLRMSNIFGTITALILALPNGLEGAKVTRIRTLARYIDGVNFPGGVNPYGTPDPTSEFPREIFYVDRKVSENRELLEFELAAVFDLIGVRAPKRQCIANICQWRYKGPECGYAGNAYFDVNDNAVALLADDVCGKRLRSCELRFAQLRRDGSTVLGNNILTLDAATSFNTGDSVTGFGVPSGTTVSSVSGNQVTMSANATATSPVSTTGTIQSNLTQIVVSSATGLAPGMTVTGSYLPSGIQTTAVSGTTVTVTAGIDLTQFLTLATTKTQAFANIVFGGNTAVTTDRLILSNRSGLQIGQYVSSDVLPISRRARIVEFRTAYFYTIVVLSVSYTGSNSNSRVWSFYNIGAIPSATYTFRATNRTYTFRADLPIPYGSFPGVGSFTQ